MGTKFSRFPDNTMTHHDHSSWTLQRGWGKVSDAYGDQPSGFPGNPWVLYSPETHHLYVSKSSENVPPAGHQWYRLYTVQYQKDAGLVAPTEEPGISVELVTRWPEGDVARISDERDDTMSSGMCHRFSGETCVSLPKHLETLCISEDLPAISIGSIQLPRAVTAYLESLRCDSLSPLGSTGKAETLPISIKSCFRLPSGFAKGAAMAGLLLVLVLGSSFLTELFAAKPLTK